MGSLLDKAMNEEDANKGSSSSNAPQGNAGAPSGGGSLLDQAMSTLGDATQQAQSSVHQQFNDAASQMSPDDLHAAATNAVQSMPPDQQAKLGSALANQGAAEGAGVPADTKEPSEIGKMIGWVHKHVPGGVPGALGLVGAAGVAAGGAYVATQNPDAVKDVVDQTKNAASGNSSASDLIDGTTAHSVFNALQSSIVSQVKKG